MYGPCSDATHTRWGPNQPKRGQMGNGRCVVGYYGDPKWAKCASTRPKSVTDPARGPLDTVQHRPGSFSSHLAPFQPSSGGVPPLGVVSTEASPREVPGPDTGIRAGHH